MLNKIIVFLLAFKGHLTSSECLSDFFSDWLILGFLKIGCHSYNTVIWVTEIQAGSFSLFLSLFLDPTQKLFTFKKCTLHRNEWHFHDLSFQRGHVWERRNSWDSLLAFQHMTLMSLAKYKRLKWNLLHSICIFFTHCLLYSFLSCFSVLQ